MKRLLLLGLLFAATPHLHAGDHIWSFDLSEEGWNIGSPSDPDLLITHDDGIGDGVLVGTYAADDCNYFKPHIWSPWDVGINCLGENENYVVLKFNLTAYTEGFEGTVPGRIQFQIKWTIYGSGGQTEYRTRKFLVRPNIGWQTVIVNLMDPDAHLNQPGLTELEFPADWEAFGRFENVSMIRILLGSDGHVDNGELDSFFLAEGPGPGPTDCGNGVRDYTCLVDEIVVTDDYSPYIPQKVVVFDYVGKHRTLLESGGDSGSGVGDTRSWMWHYNHSLFEDVDDTYKFVAWNGDAYTTPDLKCTSAYLAPIIGFYDDIDPHLGEYHVLLARLIGADVLQPEWTGSWSDVNPNWENLQHWAEHYGAMLVGATWDSAVVLECPFDETNPWGTFTSRTEKIDALLADIATIVATATYPRLPDPLTGQLRPLVHLSFHAASTWDGTASDFARCFSDCEINAIRSGLLAHPDVMANPYLVCNAAHNGQGETEPFPVGVKEGLRDNIDAFTSWIYPGATSNKLEITKPWRLFSTVADQASVKLASYYESHKQALSTPYSSDYEAGCPSSFEDGMDSFWGVLYPGFDDHKTHGWDPKQKRHIDNDGGQMLQECWEAFEDSGLSTAWLISLNGAKENHPVEPTRELGYRDADYLMEKIGRWKGSFDYADIEGDVLRRKKLMRIAARLYEIRKRIDTGKAILDRGGLSEQEALLDAEESANLVGVALSWTDAASLADVLFYSELFLSSAESNLDAFFGNVQSERVLMRWTRETHLNGPITGWDLTNSDVYDTDDLPPLGFKFQDSTPSGTLSFKASQDNGQISPVDGYPWWLAVDETPFSNAAGDGLLQTGYFTGRLVLDHLDDLGLSADYDNFPSKDTFGNDSIKVHAKSSLSTGDSPEWQIARIEKKMLRTDPSQSTTYRKEWKETEIEFGRATFDDPDTHLILEQRIGAPGGLKGLELEGFVHRYVSPPPVNPAPPPVALGWHLRVVRTSGRRSCRFRV